MIVSGVNIKRNKEKVIQPRNTEIGSLFVYACRRDGIRTHGLFVPNEARYQAAPHPVTV